MPRCGRGSADTAKTSDNAKTAQSAATAERANIATTASSAVTAGSAISAQTAKSAESATVAKSLTGHTAFSFFTPEGERQVARIAPFTVTLNCIVENNERTVKMTIQSEEGESTLAIVGKAAQTVEASTPVDVLTAKGPAATKTAREGQDFTLVSPRGTALSISSPTVGFSLDQGNHPGRCYFSGVLEQLPALPAQ